MTALILLLVAALAASRATRLLVDDKITEPLRKFAADHLRQPEWSEDGRRQVREGSKLTYLIHCTWCAGLWISAGVSALVWWGGLNAALPSVPWWAGFPLTALALGWAVGTLKSLDQN